MNQSIMVRAGFRGIISVAMTNVECATTGLLSDLRFVFSTIPSRSRVGREKRFLTPFSFFLFLSLSTQRRSCDDLTIVQ
jgi:hypothetical protein